MGQTRYVGPGIAGSDRARLNGGQELARSGQSEAAPAKEAPLSFGQLRLWFLDQLEPGTATYNMPMALRLKGRLDRESLQHALEALVARHQVLRTTFVCHGEDPKQVVNDRPELDFQTIKLKSNSAGVSSALGNGCNAEDFHASSIPTGVRQAIREEINRPFNLNQGRLLRVRLLELERDDHVLVVTMHHIVSDEWSWKIFFQELGALYQVYAIGPRGHSPHQHAGLPALPMQYVDYATRQREAYMGGEWNAQFDYWREQLKGRQALFEIPTDRPRIGASRSRGAVARRELGRELTEQCRGLEKQQQVTNFMLHLAAFNALLSRYTQREDVLVGCPVAGRGQLETELMMGFFVNTLVLRTKVDPEQPFAQLLRDVRRLTIESWGNQDVPIEKLVEELQPERELSHLPFTRLMFATQNEMFERARWGELEIEFLDVETETAKFDLTLIVQGSSRGLIARAEYNADLFDGKTIERMLEHYEVLLRAAVSKPDTRIRDLPLMTDHERRLVLETWNATNSSYPRNKLIHELFERQAASTPDATAVSFGKKILSYRELNARANQLARYLRANGVERNGPVAICVERSVEMVVAMLAVLKAGGAYVPLDPEYPAERLEFMLLDTASPVVLTQQRVLVRLPKTGAQPICLDAEWERIARESKDNLNLQGSAGQLAYVMYTSGSTGTPKGVAVPHNAVNRLVLNTNYVQLGNTDRIAQASNVSFDAATFEIWGALLNGATLVGIPSDVLLSPADFARMLQEEKITILFLTAALFNQIASEARDAFTGLETLIVGGEALDPKWIRRVLGGKPPRRLLNGYGPTENTTFTCCHLITDATEEGASIPIGRPISNTQVYILDRFGNPAPVGVPGELHAGGEGLALGYWNEPEMTAERFVPNPFLSTEKSELLYKTGDIARFLPNGEIEFLGRADDQVKIRGFRIELGEVEAALARVAGIKTCAAKVWGAGAEYRKLAVYYVAESENSPNLELIRAHLRSALPAYMQPSAFVQLANMPISSNGKVNRSALPEPEQARPALEKTPRAARDSIDERLVSIWQDVLGVSPVGIEDRFFDLGGHSLLALQLVSRIEREFGRKLRLSTIFQAPTIQDLSLVLREEVKESSVTGRSSVVEIQARGTRKPLFLVHGAGGGMFWGYMNLSRYLGPDQPVYGFRSRGLDGRQEFERLEDMAEDYVEDLRVVQPKGPYFLGGYCFGGNVAYEMARLLKAQGEEVQLLALFNCSPPNSAYTQIKITPAWIWRFLTNLFHWKDYFLQWTHPQRKAFFQWKWQQSKKHLRNLRTLLTQRNEADIGDLIDLSSFTVEERKVWEAHIRALLKHNPKPYDGKVHLFRSPSHPLWCSFDSDYGWGELAKVVEVTIVPAAHERILEEPCVRELARELDQALASVGSSSEVVTGRQIDFWPRTLRDAPALLDLPTDRPRPAVQSGKMQSERIALSSKISKGVGAVAGELGAQTFDVLLASLHTLLYRYTRQEDIVIAAGAAEDVLPIRAAMDETTPFATIVKSVTERLWLARQNRKPFADIVADVKLNLEPSHHPITQVAFTANLMETLGYSQASIRDTKTPGPWASFDLVWDARKAGGDIEIELTYAEDLFDASTAIRMLQHWESLLLAIIYAPRLPVGALAILPHEERRLLLEQWTATQSDYRRDQTLAGLFYKQVLRTPEAEAVVSGHTRLSYRQLYSRANVVAHRLKQAGVGREDLVGICTERTWEMLAGILGTLLAGAAYVPMDPHYPADRLKFMLEDARMKVLFTQRKLGNTLPEGEAAILLADEIDWNCSTFDSVQEPASTAAPTDLAYVIYTSGSTGKPKGVAIEHRNAVALIFWAKQVFTAEELAGVLASTSICFDLSIFEMFVPLCLGGKMILAENALALPSIPATNEVRLINTVPSAARELVRAKGIPNSVQVINLAGEPLPSALADTLYGETSIKKVYDLYGPTETTTYSTYALRMPGARPTIGRPLTNEQVYLLDSSQQPVPIGVPGEIYIAGDGVTRGYLNRPELTNERFLANPFRPGERMYRTGDFARWRADGNLEFLGRLDNQVKVRGFRIELGEIEAAMRTVPGVKDALVVAREDQPGQKRLVGYAVADRAGGITTPDLRVTLRKALPEYMVPQAFVLMEALPMTPNGKVDRKALPRPGPAESRDRVVTEPKTPTQSIVASAWCEVLQTGDFDLDQNFFEAGGDSLQATQVISRLQERLGVKLPLSGMYEAPTINTLSEAIESGRWSSQPAHEIALAPIPRSQPLQASFIQELVWFFEQLLPGNAAYNVTGAWRICGPLDCAALEAAFQCVAVRHETLRTRFAYQDGVLRQVISPSARIPLVVRDLSQIESHARIQKTQEMLSAECRKPFDVGSAPLIRALLLRSSAKEHVLLVVAHHTIFDGWSFGLLLRELEAFYAAHITGGQASLPALRAQYADFAAWQRECMKGARLLGELEYWKAKLAGAPEYLELPLDCAERNQATTSAARFTTQLGSTIIDNLGHVAKHRRQTTFHLLMSALAITLAKWTGRQEMVIGTVVAGRSRTEIENVIGCFMNFLPIRLNVSEAETGDAILQRVKATVAEAQAHEDCPFEKIVEALNPERRLDRNPLYNVALLFQNYRMGQWNSAGLQVNPIPPPSTGALLDLRFEIEPIDEGLLVACDYQKEMFEEATIARLVESFCQTVQSLARDPSARISDLALPIQNYSRAAATDQEKARVAIASTFTAEPVAEPLRHWFRELELPVEIEFAPFNQVFQQLLDSGSLLRSNQSGINVLLIRLQDWRKVKWKPERDGANGDGMLERTIKEFVAGVRTAAAACKTPWLVGICPESPQAKALHAQCQMELIEQLNEIPNVHVLSPPEFQKRYPVRDYYDRAGEELGHVPYTPVFFTALATAIARKYHALKRPPLKVIALDCDQTLWSGICGEDGAQGVCLTPEFRKLQEFMLEQQQAGRLLCLCSKNNERDVLEVFQTRKDMPLRAEHFAGWRLNWQPKSENLKSLAAELGLGLDSFVFVDDNPLECAEVEANCPEVLALQLPDDPEEIPQFLEHVWVFDRLKLTAEDRKRSEMYRQNRERERLREHSLSLADFLASLELEIKIEPLTPQNLARAAQLTQRTNQFNLTTLRRTEAELQALAGGAEIATVSVKDRFGDYGLTGLLMFKQNGGALDVDTFLLSCRVLGRGVEHNMLAWLGGVAQARKLNWVDVHFRNSARNRPALDFLDSVGARFRQTANGGFLFRFPAGFAAEVVFNPQNAEIAANTGAAQHDKSDAKLNRADRSRQFPKFSRCREIALELCDPLKIHQAIEAKAIVRACTKLDYIPPQNEIEKRLCELWQELLRVEKVGVMDDFFELGGHSLLAVRLFAEIEKQFGRKLPLVTLFQNATIRKLARTLGQAQMDSGRSLLVHLQPHGRKLPLFLVHGAGGDVLWGYANLAAHLPPDQPIYGIKSRGQTGAEEFRNISEMASAYIKEIKRLQPVGPYYVGGYCFGGNVAYEMARQLCAAGEQVPLVLLLDAAPSNAGYERVTWWHPSYPFRFARNLGYWVHDFVKLDRRDQMIYIKRKVGAACRKIWRKVSFRPGQPMVDLEDVIDLSHFPEQELKLWQIHLDAMAAHVDQPFDGKVVLIRTRGQPLFCSLEEDFGWNKLARGGVQIRFSPGSHENVFMEPNVRDLARAIQDSLQFTQAQNPAAINAAIQQSINPGSVPCAS